MGYHLVTRSTGMKHQIEYHTQLYVSDDVIHERISWKIGNVRRILLAKPLPY